MTVETKQYVEIASQHDDFESWLEAHGKGIGASEIAAVLGESPWDSPRDLWLKKTGSAPPRRETQAMEWGRRLEPVVAEKYSDNTGRLLHLSGMLLQSKEYPWALCTPDYWLLHEGISIPLEVKTTRNANAWADGPPKHIWLQIQHQLLVTGAPWASTCVLVAGQEFYWADVERDEETIARIIREGDQFWKMVVTGEEPKELEIIPGTEVVLPDESQTWLDEWAVLEQEQKMNGEAISAIKERIIAELGSVEKGIFPDGSSVTYKMEIRKAYEVLASTRAVLRKSRK